MCKMLNIYYQHMTIRYLSILVPLKLKILRTMSTKKVTKKEEPLYLNLAEPNEVKSLAFPVSPC